MFRYLPLALCLATCSISRGEAVEIEAPKSLDERLTVELFASEPDIATITGLTVDAAGRVLAVESHTHFRPENYEGPETDRIRLLEDTSGDGLADRIETFFSGTTHTMNVAAHRNGWIYVATRASVLRIRDTDDDGRADQRENLVKLETTADYPHNGISGFAFDFAGNVYFSLGENMGQDGVLVAEGVRLPVLYGAGGVFRCNEDGTQLERYAIGFWNPFHLCFDAFGRMFLGDNDPGNRPPCRLLAIVEGGDYGYRRRTLEPFIAIDGETPGALPMTSSTGESPTGIIAYESEHLPADYRGNLLTASWGEHRIDRYRLEREGASFVTTSTPVVAGGEHFRPAGIAVAPDGSLYVGDWADRSYKLHGKGRIWRIRSVEPTPDREHRGGVRSADRRTRERAARRLAAEGEEGLARLRSMLWKEDDARLRSTALAALIDAQAVTEETAQRGLRDRREAVREQAARDLPARFITVDMAKREPSEAVQAAFLRRLADAAAEPLLLKKLLKPDPFLQQAARRGLRRSVANERLVELLDHPRAEVRLAAVLLLRDDPGENKLESELRDRTIEQALDDSDTRVLLATVEWIGRDRLVEFHDRLAHDLRAKATSPELLMAYLAALAQLDGVMEHWTKGKVGDWWIGQADSYRYAVPMLDDSALSPEVVQQVLRFLPEGHEALTLERLISLLGSEHLGVRLEAVRRLRELTGVGARAHLLKVANDASRAVDVRAEAVIGLDAAQPDQRDALLKLAKGPQKAVRNEALRGLRSAQLTPLQKAALRRIAQDGAATAELVSKVLQTQSQTLPPRSEIDRWMSLLEGPADRQAGERIFFHPQGPGCFRCHRIDGRGEAVGPSLIRKEGRVPLSRRRLVKAILSPSVDVDPGYVPMIIVTVDGRTATGIYHRHGGGVRSIIGSSGEVQSFQVYQIEKMRPSSKSIMPEGLAETMTTQEFRDLLAFLLEPADHYR